MPVVWGRCQGKEVCFALGWGFGGWRTTDKEKRFSRNLKRRPFWELLS